jgi:hypothetical protein
MSEKLDRKDRRKTGEAILVALKSWTPAGNPLPSAGLFFQPEAQRLFPRNNNPPIVSPLPSFSDRGLLRHDHTAQRIPPLVFHPHSGEIYK